MESENTAQREIYPAAEALSQAARSNRLEQLQPLQPERLPPRVSPVLTPFQVRTLVGRAYQLREALALIMGTPASVVSCGDLYLSNDAGSEESPATTAVRTAARVRRLNLADALEQAAKLLRDDVWG